MKQVLSCVMGLVMGCLALSAKAQLQSPEQYLGYKVGTSFTRHHKIVEYFKYVASHSTSITKLMPYGKTNEGRELLTIAISTPENISNLENIRKDNLALTTGGIKKDKQPAIVWLSYNVHGNEPASSEAAMLTLYALTSGTNKEASAWLKNVVVIIDPCINPDGRDRYVNWYNNAVGAQYNNDPQAREHMEPWPAGRTNHYNFDLNRDWAWQTQVETKQRIALYQQWYPQVHVDFHEQGFNEPYYFAPAAEPLHPQLSNWQEDFQDQIGKNNAKYFDQNHWLFFTKERFDLLYPSYGDTYPMYNGAIGMTYEQGGISAGLGVMNKNNDELTLVDRAQHHFTTSLSTVEISAHNASKLIDEFAKYYDKSRNNIAGYQTFVITSASLPTLQNLTNLLIKNNIQVTQLKQPDAGFKAYDYNTKSEGVYKNEGYHIVVDANQAHGVLASVLLEPNTQVNDSNTYDITAWSLPYAYGVHGYATKEKLATQKLATVPTIQVEAATYGYAIPYQSLAHAKLLTALLQKGIKVRYAEKAFVNGGKNYDRGTLLVLQTSNTSEALNTTKSLCEQMQLQAYPLQTGYADKGADLGSPEFKTIARAPKVAVFTGEGVSALAAGAVWNYFEQELLYPITQLNYNFVSRIDLNKYDVIIAPEGQYKELASKAMTERLQAFVKKGGVLIALENAVQQLASNADWGIKIKESLKEEKPNANQLPTYENRVNNALTSSIPGAIFKLNTDNSYPYFYGFTGNYFDLKADMVTYEPSNEAWNIASLKKDSHMAGFAGYKAKAALQEGVVIGVKEMGAGKLVYVADDPIFRNFWHAGKLLFTNMVFLNGK